MTRLTPMTMCPAQTSRAAHGMLKYLIACFLLCFLAAIPPSDSHAQPSKPSVSMIDQPMARLQTLDKITARTMTFEARVGKTIKFGPLYIRPQACRKSDPLDRPESSAFLQIWEELPSGEQEWVFSGWMFASSPALSAMDHAVYDVWVLECFGGPDTLDQVERPEDNGADRTEETSLDLGESISDEGAPSAITVEELPAP